MLLIFTTVQCHCEGCRQCSFWWQSDEPRCLKSMVSCWWQYLKMQTPFDYHRMPVHLLFILDLCGLELLLPEKPLKWVLSKIRLDSLIFPLEHYTNKLLIRMTCTHTTFVEDLQQLLETCRVNIHWNSTSAVDMLINWVGAQMLKLPTPCQNALLESGWL